MSFKNDISQISSLLISMGLNEYQAHALSYLLFLGETKATTLSETSGVPVARIYNVLGDLTKMGLVTIRPGRPSIYGSRPPEDIVDLLIAAQREKLRKTLAFLEIKAKEFIESANKLYLKGEKGKLSVPLLRVVSVGETSLEETKKIYEAAKKEILIISKAFEYLPDVSESLKAAIKRSVTIRLILMNQKMLDSNDAAKQKNITDSINNNFGKGVVFKFSNNVPIRGSIIDPEDNGQAIFLVEDPGVPFFLREAAITSHRNVVKGLAIMFNSLWEQSSD
jgi:sugar-specific transcriptional regulator TrmB